MRRTVVFLGFVHRGYLYRGLKGKRSNEPLVSEMQSAILGNHKGHTSKILEKKIEMRKYYYQIASIFLLVLSIIAFSDNLITDVGQESNSDPKFIIHGLLMFVWFIIFVAQANFIRKGNYKAHMKWGVAGFVSAILVFISTVYMIREVYTGGWNTLKYFEKAIHFFIASYAVLILLGYLNRKNGNSHKRFVYMGTLLILEPILDRVAANLHIGNSEIFVILLWNGLFISLFLYDWLTIKKIHKISWMGFVWFYVVWAISFLT